MVSHHGSQFLGSQLLQTSCPSTRAPPVSLLHQSFNIRNVEDQTPPFYMNLFMMIGVLVGRAFHPMDTLHGIQLSLVQKGCSY